MNVESLKKLLADFKDGRVSESEALDALRTLPFEDMGFAKVDHHRSLRTGFPEAVYGEGKTTEQILGIARSIVGRKTNFLVTRCAPESAEALRAEYPDGEWNEAGAVFFYETHPRPRHGYVLVVTAGTTDIPVAEEAAVTSSLFGCNVDRVYDVGVAGVHRLMAYQSMIEAADVIVVVAGMEGALASVVAGMARVPVVAVPTSVGYGASFGGLAALLGMMTSCAAGVTVVNIDNGFGAGCAAALIVQRAHELARNIEHKVDEQSR
jgi:NCAIR mutase (PurE)-related protein